MEKDQSFKILTSCGRSSVTKKREFPCCRDWFPYFSDSHKNRERLRKPSAKKKKRRQQQLQEVEEELVISDPIPLSTTRDLVDVPEPIQNLENVESSDACELVSQLSPVVEGIDDVDNVMVTDEKYWDEKDKRLLFVVLKMFLVLVLGLSTKSSSLRTFCRKGFFSICERARKCEDSSKGLIIQEIDQEEDVGGVDSCDLIDTLGMKSSVGEIEAVGFNFDMTVPVEENRGTESRMDLLSCDGKKMSIVEIEEDRSGVLVCGKEKSRNSKISRKIIEKLVPKKLRAVKKAKKNNEKEPDFGSDQSSSCWGDDEGRIEGLEDGDKQGFETQSRCSEQKKKRINERKGKESYQGVSSSSTGWQAKMEVVVVEKGKIEKKGSSDYLILFFVALAGLVGGRSLSLVLTLASCLMIKLVGRYRFVNEPVNSSPASIPS
uniref:Uncharacterized protein n=1 Tax=Salix viminalis TaxID=40686 RepID=A0A6N2LGI7_SALVM